VPYKIRNDKPYANGYKIGLSNIETIFSPFTGENSYFNYNIQNDVYKATHIISANIRFYMLNRIPLFTPKFSVLDVAGGRGADVNNLNLKGCSKFFVKDLDNKALIKYCSKIKEICIRNIESHPEIKTNHVNTHLLTLFRVNWMLITIIS
jgi:hypothetical protein